MELSMEISNEAHRCAHGLDVVFLDKDLLKLVAEKVESIFLYDSSVFQSLDMLIDVEFSHFASVQFFSKVFSE